MKKTLIVAAVSASFATAASAQSSVTLYGLIDAGFAYTNNVVNPGAGPDQQVSKFGMTSGNLQGSRWGLRGQEDLGGGLKAVFTLENGFNITNGTASQGGRQFGRQAYVGLSSAVGGTVTLGRQYDSVVDYLGPITSNGSWGGTYFSHPFDNDNTNNSFRVNNAIKYQSVNYGGFTFGGLYGFSNDAGSFANNRAYSAGMQYANGPFKIAAAYLQTQGAGGAATDGGAIADPVLASDSRRTRTYGVGANYSVGALVFGGVWTQTRLDESVLFGNGSFNNFELNARYHVTPALALGGAYTYTRARFDGVNDNHRYAYHQFGLQADYLLSKRTDIYAEGVVETTRSGVQAQIFGTDASSSNHQVVVSAGIRHRF
ncbi:MULTISPECIES: porin [unclassified Caballeronia]|uniref:porin n=1 Tax=unclassified Caballeronia TaxID=2646786 RepID=UPI00285B9468|nr:MULTISPECIES: porin [unclassified Caballeronia]MDR5749508.1 porin [Caballeronia sp. LZ024]MDR5843362.1 porin [Caballeronia sp. LZ031]